MDASLFKMIEKLTCIIYANTNSIQMNVCNAKTCEMFCIRL